MIFTLEVATNPGPRAWFVTEVRVESTAPYQPRHPWWGLWLGWWLYPLRDWREWLWTWEHSREGRWHIFLVRVAGFEFNWQRWSRK